MFGYRNLGFGVDANAGGAATVNWSNYDSTGDKTPVVFSAVATSRIACVNIDSTRALIVYRGTSNYCRARIASVDGDGLVTFGTEAVVLSASILDADVRLLDSTHAIVVVESGSAVKCIAIEFSGTTISSVGSAVSTESVNSDHLAVAAISSTEFFVAYEDTAANPRVFYATVSGTTVTMGNGIDFDTLNLNDMSMCKLNSTQAVILAANAGTPDFEAHLIGYTGTTPQVDDSVTVKNGSYTSNATDIERIDDNTLIAVYTSSFGTVDTWAVIITESGGSLTVHTEETINANLAEEQGIAIMDSTHAVSTMGRNSVNMESTVIEISGTTLTALTTYENVSGDKEYVGNCPVGQNWVLACYEDDNNSSYGTAMVLGV